MANKDFIVKNGLKVGALSVDAATGDLTTTGSITVSAPGSINVDNIGVDSISKNDTSVSITDTGASGSSIGFSVDNVSTATVTNGGFNVVAGDLTVSNNAVVTGNLTVNGTTTTVDTANMLVTDPLIVLSKDTSGSPIADGGFVVERGTSTNVAFMWDESADEFVAVNTTDDGTTAGNVAISSYANFQANNIAAAGFSGPLTGNVTGNVSGTAASWANSRTITLDGYVSGSVVFDGSANATLTSSLTTAIASTDISDWAEAVQDTVGGMVSGNTESGIAVTYDDGAGKLNFNVNDPTISLTGDVTGSAVMTDLGNVSISTTLTNTSHSHDTQYYTKSLADARYLRLNVANATSGSVTWSDGSFAAFGTGQDLYLTHNGTNSFIDNVTGELRVRQLVNDGTGRIQGYNGAVQVDCVTWGGAGQSAELLYGGSVKLATTATGVTVTGTMTGTASAARYADLAENYVADAAYGPGTVVGFGGEKEVTSIIEDGSTRQAGVVSTNPAYLMNKDCEGEHVVAVAFTGRVPCKVKGFVAKGDMMVAAGNGYARAEAHPAVGSVIGKALESFSGDEGVIEVVVGR